MRDLVIVGAGGHGRELFVTVAAINAATPTWRILGFVDDDPQHLDRIERLGSRVLGDTTWLESHPCYYAIGIGTSAVRREITTRLEDAGCEPTTIVHPGAHIGLDVRLAEGVVIYDRCTITTNVDIGTHTHLNVGCTIHHDTTVGDFVQFSPGVFVNGDCSIGNDVFLGTGMILVRGSRVGDNARVGAGSVVLRDVDPSITVMGVPARSREG